MKKLYIAFFSLILTTPSWSQIFVQDFNFTGALTGNGWTAHSAGGTSVVSTTTGSTYNGFPGTGVGNAALLGNAGGEDVNITFPNQNTNGQNVYYSALVNITDAAATKSGDYFMHLGTPGGASFTLFAARLYVKITGGVVYFGISNTSTGTYGVTAFAKNTTYLIVVKYVLNTTSGAPGANPSTPVSFWVIPSGVPQTELSAGSAEVLVSNAGQVAINAIGLRQGSATASVQTVVDGIRVGTTWESVTGFVSAATGTWSTPATWTGGVAPIANSNVFIAHNITLDVPATINNLDLQSGILATSSTNTLTVAAGTNAGIITGGSSTSFINGPLTRNTATTTAVLFPVGKGGTYRPVSVIPTSTAAGVYTAEYFNTTSPTGTYHPALTGVAQNEYWDVSRASGPDAQIQLTYTAGNTWSSGAPTTTDYIAISHLIGGVWYGENGDVVPGTSTGATITTKPLSSFSPFTFGFGPSTLLPLDIVNFTAIKATNGNIVSWSAANAINVQTIDIERSANGRDFGTLKQLIAGNSSYQYTDASPISGVNYYRLKIANKNGSFQFSKVVAVINGAKGVVVTGVYPTITTGLLMAEVSAEGVQAPLQFRFIDLQGRTTSIKRIATVTGIASLDVSSLAKGTYLLQVMQSDKAITNFKIIKQ